jgi:5-deoxy-D-glucuronate isomerase
MDKIVICEICRSEGKKSRVTPHGGTRHLLGWESYYDEEGKYHAHDPNYLMASFSCSNGHSWQKNIPNTCWCGWTTDKM